MAKRNSFLQVLSIEVPKTTEWEPERDIMTTKKKRDAKQSPPSGGDCFDSAVRVLYSLEDDSARLVHGIVDNTLDGRPMLHAWTERELFPGLIVCVDKSNGHDVTVPRDLYYKIGNVRGVERYTIERAAENMIRFEHYGPWTNELLRVGEAREEGDKGYLLVMYAPK